MITLGIASVLCLFALGVVKRIIRGKPADQVEEPKEHIDDEDQCPECGAQWKGDDIFEHFKMIRDNPDHESHGHYKDKTDEEIMETASHYGYTKEEPRHFRHIIGMELAYDHPQHYDGVSYWMCPGCKATWNRWTNQREDIPPNPNAKTEDEI